MIIVFFCLGIISTNFLFALDAVKLLDDIDALRVYSTDGFAFDMSVTDDEGALSVMRIYVNKYDESICAYKNDAKGRYILLKDKSFWFYDKGMNSPIRISERQLLVGQASSGDITRIVFSELYDISGSSDEEEIYTLDLQAKKNAGATYDKIKLYINKKDIKPVKAECSSKTGIVLKTIYYNDFKKIDGKELLVGFKIVNELTKESSNVELADFKAEKLPANHFNKNYMRFLRIN
jgi:outer membrane lipoprotein-sorting protein